MISYRIMGPHKKLQRKTKLFHSRALIGRDPVFIAATETKLSLFINQMTLKKIPCNLKQFITVKLSSFSSCFSRRIVEFKWVVQGQVAAHK